jgi:hypothetical protein
VRALLALFLAGCALLGDPGGGNQNLPLSGVGPFGKLSDITGKTPLQEPFVITDPTSPISDPAPLVLPDGSLRIFYGRGGSEIWRADLPSSLTQLPSMPATVLAPTGDEGRTAAPSVVQRGNQLFLYYETVGGIARATSLDGGASFSRDGMVLPGAARPGAVLVVEVIFLYFTRPGDPALWVATSTDGRAFNVAPDPALEPSGSTWDVAGLTDPSAAVAMPTGPRGEIHVGLYYTGTDANGVSAIGYAGSDDGVHFQAVPTPIMEPGLPNESGPAAILTPGRAILLFTQDRSGKLAIGAAVDP